MALTASQLEAPVEPEALSPEQSNRINVVARIRPFLSHEVRPPTPCLYNMGKVIYTKDPNNKNIASQHPFDTVLDPTATQDQAYESVAGDVYKVMCGTPMLLIAYGITSSGKSYTLFGDDGDSGVFGRAIYNLFSIVSSLPIAKQAVFRVSAVQIYMTYITDLLNKNEILKAHGSGFDPLPGRSWAIVHSPEDTIAKVREALLSREMAATQFNSVSSRSHCIITFVIELPEAGQSTCLTVVDLAGSEPHLPGASKQTQQESSFIRTSLLCLDRALKDLKSLGSAKSASVSFRSSPLTMALKPFLQPTKDLSLPCNVVIFLNLHGKLEGFYSNKETLQLGLVAKNVKNYSKTASRLGVLSTNVTHMVGSMARSVADTKKPGGAGELKGLKGSMGRGEFVDDIVDDDNMSVISFKVSRSKLVHSSSEEYERDGSRRSSGGLNVFTSDDGSYVTMPVEDWTTIINEFERLAIALQNAAVESDAEIAAARRDVVAEMTQLMEINISKEREGLLTDIVERDAEIQRLNGQLLAGAKDLDAAAKRLHIAETRLRIIQEQSLLNTSMASTLSTGDGAGAGPLVTLNNSLKAKVQNLEARNSQLEQALRKANANLGQSRVSGRLVDLLADFQ